MSLFWTVIRSLVGLMSMEILHFEALIHSSKLNLISDDTTIRLTGFPYMQSFSSIGCIQLDRCRSGPLTSARMMCHVARGERDIGRNAAGDCLCSLPLFKLIQFPTSYDIIADIFVRLPSRPPSFCNVAESFIDVRCTVLSIHEILNRRSTII